MLINRLPCQGFVLVRGTDQLAINFGIGIRRQ